MVLQPVAKYLVIYFITNVSFLEGIHFRIIRRLPQDANLLVLIWTELSGWRKQINEVS